MPHETTTVESVTAGEPSNPTTSLSETLVLVWNRDDDERLGDALTLPRDKDGKSYVFGRGEEKDGRRERLLLVRQRPGENLATAPLTTPQLSRTQLVLRRHPDGGIDVENVGKRELLVGGVPVTRARVQRGDVVEIRGQLAFVSAPRPATFPALRSPERRLWPAYGQADAFGYVGESPEAWRIRDELAVVARRSEHVLVLGESGVGKEILAQALHGMSARAGKKLVSRNAATVPAGIIDAEIFGNAANYPNAGMSERPGLVGEADGATLYLDEVGELPVELQTHFLRLLDGGDYQRLGDARRRTADLRLLAATNRPVGQLRSDLVARFPIRIQASGLHARREDIPLLARHILRKLEAGEADTLRAHARASRLSRELTLALVQHLYSTHVREMVTVILRARLESTGPVVELTPGARELLAGGSAVSEEAREVTRDEIVLSLARNKGSREKAWRELGLASRHVLKRLMRKYELRDDEG